ncbi:MAG: TraR/DksA family transcriptional regulator [Fuerstiella sp.]
MIDKQKLKRALEAKLRELQERAADIEEDLSSKPDADWEENAVESEDDEVLAGIGDLTKHDIREIKLALSSLENGTYGICTTCGAEIPEARLKVLPYTTTCVKCA